MVKRRSKMVAIIAHRGYWKNTLEKNNFIAFQRAFENGFGVETDFRDYKGNLVISHDIPSGDEMTADDFFKLYSSYSQKYWLALNIKADGLQPLLMELIDKYQIENYFCFDMSIPDTLGYINQNLKTFSRVSEYEKELPFYDKSTGVWLDCFISDWFSGEEIQKYLNNDKFVCVVSSDLHKREYKDAWAKYKLIRDQKLILCTDHPEEAREFFNDKD